MNRQAETSPKLDRKTAAQLREEIEELKLELIFRETEEEFGISPKALIPIGTGPVEPDTGLTPYLFLCTDYEGEPDCVDLEMTNPTFRTLEEIHDLAASLFQPFADGLKVLEDCVCPFEEDGGPDSGNHNHEGVPGQVGGSAPNGGENNLGSKTSGEVTSELKKCGKGSKVTVSVYDRDMDETYNDTFELGDDGNWTSPNSGRSLSEEELAHVISDKDTKESSLDVKGSGERIEPEGFASRMESFVGGGYSVGDILEKDDIEFIKNNMSETDQPLYRIEESRFTASSAEVGQELQFNGELRSFTRNSKVTNSMLDENSDEYAYMEDPVVFKTVGATKQFDVSPYAGAYATSQEESFVGGKFEVVGKGTYTAPNGNEYPMITIRQKGNTDGSTNPNISEKSIDKSARTATITIEENSDEGNSNSGNHNHGGRPGKIGGSTPKPSANGENTPCLDFADKKKRKKHFRSHGHEYSGLNEEQYVQHAIDFLKQPCGGDIDGFLSKDGEIYRFNTKTGELAVGVPGGAIKTCFHLRYNRKKGAVDIAAANRVFQNKKATESKTGS